MDHNKIRLWVYKIRSYIIMTASLICLISGIVIHQQTQNTTDKTGLILILAGITTTIFAGLNLRYLQ